MSCGVGCRLGLDLALMQLWCRPAALAPIRPLGWELPYAVDAALKSKNNNTNNNNDDNDAEQQGFLISVQYTDIWGQIFLFCWGILVHYRMFWQNSRLLPTRCQLHLPSIHQQKCLQTLPNVSGKWGQNHPWLRCIGLNRYLRFTNEKTESQLSVNDLPS